MMKQAEEKWYDWIENSFLPQEMKTGYIMIKERMSRL